MQLQARADGMLLCAACELAWPKLAGVQELHGLDSRQAMWAYAGSVRRLLVQAKDMPHGAQAWALLHALMASLQHVALPSDAIWTTPPPSNKRRLGDWYLPQFLAQKLARTQGQCCRKLLRRRRSVKDQAELNGTQRRANLLGVFAARRSLGSAQVPARVVLFDDVSTTGATMVEAARALRALGVQEVHGISVAVVA